MSSSAPIAFGPDATIQAWKSALAAYKRSVPKKDYQQIQQSTSAQDVVAYAEELQKKEQHSQHAKLLEVVGKHLGRFERFSQAVDMLAQGLPDPACLIWGSIKFAIFIVRDYAEEHQKLLKALQLMAEFLPRTDFYAELFANSAPFKESIHKLYVSIIRFWARAIKFYKQRRLWKFARFWSDFDVEFGAFELEIRQCQQKIEDEARVEHMSKAHVFRLEQTKITQAMLASINSQERRDIVKWLAPAGYEADYFEDDMDVARKLRHEGTCEWVLSMPQFNRWLRAVAPSDYSFLWVYAIPGAGKTVLTAFLIDSQTSIFPAAPLLIYFFFKNTDADKNTPTAAARSLLYQLYRHLRNSKEDIASEITEAINKSGQINSKSFRNLWDLVVKFASYVPELVIILDALDECNEAGSFLRRLLKISREASVKIICTSRREKEQVQELETVPSFEMGPKEVSEDIRVFIEYKVSKSPKLCHPLIHSSIIRVLRNRNRGMFLWVALMIKELKSKASIHQIRESLESLPEGLDKVYERILTRLHTSLRSSAREFCCRLLKWIVCATRPLKLKEMQDALQIDYSANNFLGSDETLLYSERDFELACGSLVVVRSGTIELLHLSARDYLQKTALDPELPRTLSAFFVDSEKSSSSLATHCTSYLVKHCSPGSFSPEDTCQWVDSIIKSKAKLPLLEYASLNWLVHATDGVPTVVLASHSSIFSFIHSQASLVWVYLCLVLENYSSYQLRFDLGQFLERAVDEDISEAHMAFDILQKWLRSWLNVLEDYFQNLDETPSDILFMHPEDIFGSQGFPFRKPATTNEYERLTPLKTLISGTNSRKGQENRYLEKKKTLGLTLGFHMRFFTFDSKRDCFFFLDEISINSYQLYCQERLTGRRLHRLTDNELGDEAFRISIEGGQLSSDGDYLGLVCTMSDPVDVLSGKRFYTAVWRIQDHLDFKSGRRNGAWGNKIISITTLSPGFKDSLRPLTFAKGILYGPSGQIQLNTRDIKEHPSTLFQKDEVGDPLHLAFSGDGNYVVASDLGSRKCYKSTIDGRNLETFSPPEDTVIDEFTLYGFSHTGRYMLWRECHPDVPILVLQDTLSGQRHLLREDPEMMGKTDFTFSSNESQLVGIYQFMNNDFVLERHVLVWSLDEGPVLYGRKALRHAVLQSYLDDETHTLYLALALGDSTCRLWQRLSLSDHELRDLDTSTDEVNPARIVQKVCRDGKWLATLQHDNNRVNLSFQDLYDTEADGIFTKLNLNVTMNTFKDFEVVFSPDVNTVLLNDKVFLNLRQDLHSQPLSLPLTLSTVNKEQIDEVIQWKKTTEISTSSCSRYVAVNQRIQVESGMTVRLEVFDVNSTSVSCLRHARLKNSLRQCTGLQIDFHPCSPKLALMLWDETDETNESGNPCERVRCVIWDLETDHLSTIGEILDFSASFKFRTLSHDWQGTKFSGCGSYVILYWNRPTCQEFIMPGHNRTSSSTSRLPCMLASRTGVSWDGKTCWTGVRGGKVYVQIHQSEGDSVSECKKYLTRLPACADEWDVTLLNGDQKHPKLRLLLTRQGGLADIKQLRMTWDEFLKFPDHC